MSKKKSKPVSPRKTKSRSKGSTKKAPRKTTGVRRHAAPAESELVRSELAIASLYAEIYLRRTGVVLEAPVDESWKDVPVLRMLKNNKEVSVRWLEKHDRFGVAVPASYSEANGGRPKANLEWLTFLPELSEGPTLTRDLLLALDWNPRYLGVSAGHMRYEFSRSRSEADDQSGLRDLIHREIRSYRGKRSTSKRFRPVFPAPNGFELIAFDLPDLPAWALRENWLVKKLIVSPIEFRRMRSSLVIETSHLPDYANWILSQKFSATHYETETFKVEVREEIQRFIQLLVQTEGESEFLISHHGKSSERRFTLEDTATILGVPITPEIGYPENDG